MSKRNQVAILAPFISPQNPYDLAQLDVMDSRLEPGAKALTGGTYWLGTDDQGRDMLSAIFYGLRISLSVGVASTVLALIIGLTMGLVAAAVATADGPALDAVSTEFEGAGLILSAADSAAQAAPLHEHAGERRKCTESAARALRLAVQCGGATTLATRLAAQPLPVTSREREIAAMIAEGLSNREIAERLTVSVRTVEGHIYRACIKLDVSDRDELAKIIRQDVKK